MNTVETLFFVLFVLVSFFLLWKLYSAATETYIEATGGIRDIRAKGKEICGRAEVFLRNEDNRKKLKRAAVDILAAGISHGIQEAHRRIHREGDRERPQVAESRASQLTETPNTKENQI